MIITIGSANTHLLNKKKKKILLVMRTLRFTLLIFLCIVQQCYLCLSCCTLLFLVLIYNWKFVPLTIILQFLLSPNLSPLIVTSLVPISMSFIFFKITHISEIIQHFYFSLWLISLAIMPSRSIHGVANGRIFYIFMTE